MRVLVTGGTGVVGVAAVNELLRRGHTVRLLSRNAERDVKQFAGDVEAFPASVSDPEGIRGAAEDCEAVVHVVGIVAETPPDVTFQRVNVDGTRFVVEEAERAGVKRLVYVSSLGADIGRSNYHQSKLSAEQIVETFSRDWIILRPGAVYGPGDEIVSLLLQMVRTLPAVPVIDGGDTLAQPIWADDLALAIAESLQRYDLAGRILDLAGPEKISMNAMLDRLSTLTGKQPVRLPLPGWLAEAGANFLKTVGANVPFSPDQVVMLTEGNAIREGVTNALTDIFGIEGTSVSEALKRLVDGQAEQLPREGVGPMHSTSARAHIVGSNLSAQDLFETLRSEFASFFPSTTVTAEPEPRESGRIEEGASMTLGLPLRGNVQVRVQEVGSRSLTLGTLVGHPLAGAVKFEVDETIDGVDVKVTTWDRASTPTDAVALNTVGRTAQQFTWQTFIENLVTRSGGTTKDGVQVDQRTLSEDEAKGIEEWLEDMVQRRKRTEAEGNITLR